MSRTIKNIEEIQNNKEIGYCVHLVDVQDPIKVVIDNYSHCCEEYGYITTLDDLSEFNGAQLYQLKITDKNLLTKPIPVDHNCDKTLEAIFVTFTTSKGDFQLVVYNSHNGYYGHNVTISAPYYNFLHQEKI